MHACLAPHTIHKKSSLPEKTFQLRYQQVYVQPTEMCIVMSMCIYIMYCLVDRDEMTSGYIETMVFALLSVCFEQSLAILPYPR